MTNATPSTPTIRTGALGALALAAAFALAAPGSAQARQGAAGGWQVPRTEHGHPDLQGNWTNATLTPIERPSGRPAVLSWE